MKKHFEEWCLFLTPDVRFANSMLGDITMTEFLAHIKEAKAKGEYELADILGDRDDNPDVNININGRTYKKVWWTSDTHFSHKNIIKYASRPHSSVQEMDDDLIRRWNHYVGDDDLVFHLGDISLTDPARTRSILDTLNGSILFIKGNHDKSATDNKCLSRFVRTVQGGVQVPYREYMNLKIIDPYDIGLYRNDGRRDRMFVMSHYPIASWDAVRHGSIHLFGHCHGTFDHRTIGKMLDVGVDGPISYFRPLGLNQILVYMDNTEMYTGFDQ